MVFGKRQVILASLVAALSIAVYLSYQFDNTNLPVTNKVEDGKNYGDAQLVSGQQQEGGDLIDAQTYFTQAKLSRTKTRDQAVATLQMMITDSALTEQQKGELTTEATEIAQAIETEGKIENLILAKGFADCMVYLDTDKINVIVKTAELQAVEAAQIKDIILKETSVPVENISIVEVN